MKYASYFLIILISQLSFAQEPLNAPKGRIPEFGEIDDAILKMKSCPFEPDAPAMILIDYRSTRFDINGYVIRLVTERRVRIKLFNEKGLAHANIIIPYLNRKNENRIKDISAITYNIGSSGSVIKEKIEKKQIFKEKSDEDIRTVKFAFTNVKPGSVVEYRYTQIEKNVLGIDPWIIQDQIPTETRICEVRVPAAMEIEYRKLFKMAVEIRDSVSFHKYIPSNSDRILKFTASNVPSFVREPFMSSLKDNLQRVEFSFRRFFGILGISDDESHSWYMMNRRLKRSAYFGRWMNADIAGTGPVIDSAKRIQNEEEKIRYLFDQVRTQVKWDGGLSFVAEDLANCWSTKSGTTGEINLLLTNLLRKSGVYCLPLLVSTRKNGKVNKDFISLTQFNSVVVLITGEAQTFVLDASRKYNSYKTTPSEILNRDAFAIDSVDGQWFHISDHRPLHKQVINVLVFLDSTEKLKGEAAVFLYDYAKEEGLRKRDKKDIMDEDDEEEKASDLIISDFSELDAEDPLKPLIQRFKFNYHITSTGDLHYFNPIFISSLTSNPFIADTRQTDVDMGPNQLMTMTVIVNLPPNIKPEFVPGNMLLRNADSTISLHRINSVEPSRIVFKIVLEIHQTIFTKEEYPALRDFYKKLFALLNEQIVLKKVE